MRLMLAAFCLLAPALPALSQGFDELKEQCTGCHGENGISDMEEVPSLGGIEDYYALLQLVAFRERNRPSEIMQQMVEGMSNDDLRAAAAWIDGLPPPPPAEDPLPQDIATQGAALADEHRCTGCHGANLRGGHQMPPLRNQREDYLAKALHDFRAEERIGDRAAMVEVATALDDDEIAVLAQYLSGLGAEETGTGG